MEYLCRFFLEELKKSCSFVGKRFMSWKLRDRSLGNKKNKSKKSSLNNNEESFCKWLL